MDRKKLFTNSFEINRLELAEFLDVVRTFKRELSGFRLSLPALFLGTSMKNKVQKVSEDLDTQKVVRKRLLEREYPTGDELVGRRKRVKRRLVSDFRLDQRLNSLREREASLSQYLDSLQNSRVQYIQRIKRRLAFFVVCGKRNSYIRKQLGITQKRLDELLQNPQIQETITRMEQEIYGQAERSYAALFLDSVSRLRKVLYKESTSPDQVIKAVDLIWRAQGRLPTGKGSETTIYNSNQGTMSANVDVDRNDARNILRFLQAMKDQEFDRPVQGAEE